MVDIFDSEGVITLSANAVIEAPIDLVWQILYEFDKYGEWNPLTRSQILVESNGRTPLEDQTPRPGAHLLMTAHVPATMDDSRLKFMQRTQPLEIIHRCSHEDYTLEWENLSSAPLLHATRRQTLTVGEDGKTVYVSKEKFTGLGAYAIKWVIRKDLQYSFDVMATALKERAESMGR
jgi:hypothetical protein